MLIAFDVMIPSFAYDEIDMEKLKKPKMYSGYDKKGEWYQLYVIACERCDLTEAYLHGANLSKADLSDANLSDANLSGADLGGAKLSRTNLSGANLFGANLRQPNFNETVMS